MSKCGEINMDTAETEPYRDRNTKMAKFDGSFELLEAIVSRDFELVNYFLDCGADVNDVFGDGRSALHIAADVGSPEICWELIRRGANINAETCAGFTPLFFAVRRNLQTVEVLLQNGCSVEMRNCNDDSVLHAAASFGRDDVVSRLISSGCDVNAQNAQGLTPLLLATISGSRRAVKTLMQSGADPNQVSTGPTKCSLTESLDFENAFDPESCEDVRERVPREEGLEESDSNRNGFLRDQAADGHEGSSRGAHGDCDAQPRQQEQQPYSYQRHGNGHAECRQQQQQRPEVDVHHRQHHYHSPSPPQENRSVAVLNSLLVSSVESKDVCSSSPNEKLEVDFTEYPQQKDDTGQNFPLETFSVSDHNCSCSQQRVQQDNRMGSVASHVHRRTKTSGYQHDTFSTCKGVSSHRKHRRLSEDQRRGEILSPQNKLYVGKLLRDVITTTAARPSSKTPRRIEVKMVKGITPLHRAAQLGLESVAEVLLEAGANVNAMTQSGETPLHFAALYSSISGRGEVTGLLRLLLKAGADVNAVTSSGETPLHFAALVGDALTTAILISAGADVRVADHQGHVPLHKVCSRVVAPESNRVRTARLLLSTKADPNVLNFAGLSPLHSLLLTRETPVNLDLLREFLARGADPNKRTLAGQHPLLLTLDANQMGYARALIEKDADPNVVFRDGTTPMHLACKHGSAKLFKHLLSKGGDPRKPDDARFTPLRYAVASGSEEMLRACVESGAATWQRVVSSTLSVSDEICVDNFGRHPSFLSKFVSPFFYAFYTADIRAMKLLMAAGAVSMKELDHLRSQLELSALNEHNQQQREAFAFVTEVSQSPSSLQNLSRWKISHLIGCQRDRNLRVRSLQIPAMLKEFVLLADIV